MTPLVRQVSGMLYPVTIAVGVALLVKGYAAVGDGFSAGVMAGLGAIARYVGLGATEARRTTRAVRHAWLFVLVGLALMLATALWPLLAGLPPLTHFPRPGRPMAHLGAIELHTALVFDTGVYLMVFGAFIALLDRLIGRGLGRKP